MKTESPSVISGMVSATVTIPGSKSITNRALILATLAEGTTTLHGTLESEDTYVLLQALSQLGLAVHQDSVQHRMTVTGYGGIFPVKQAEIYVGNSGTTARFLTAALALTPPVTDETGHFDGVPSPFPAAMKTHNSSPSTVYRIYGKPRMHERPIGDLVTALQQCGAVIESENQNDCPPLLIFARTLNDEAVLSIKVAGNVSSQFLSAILMAAPLVSRRATVEIEVVGTLVSVPYIAMTLTMMKSFGVNVEEIRTHRHMFRIPITSQYQPQDYVVEPDASAASYFFAAAAVCGGKITVPGLSPAAMQGDVRFVECLRKMGCTVTYQSDSITVARDPMAQPLRGITVDMNDISDTAQTLAVVAMFAEGPTRIENIAHVRHKETDRIAAPARELRKLGATVEEFEDGFTIIPQPQVGLYHGADIETYDDHRMAMSFAIAGLRIPDVRICNPECTEKTFPTFFQTLAAIHQRV